MLMLSTIGGRTFPVAGPQVWNNLPEDITPLQSLPIFRKDLNLTFSVGPFPISTFNFYIGVLFVLSSVHSSCHIMDLAVTFL